MPCSAALQSQGCKCSLQLNHQSAFRRLVMLCIAELTRLDSGYEAGEEGPVQAGPEGTAPHSPTSEQPSSATLSPHSHYPSSSVAYSQPQVTQPPTQHADFSNSAAESAPQHDYAEGVEKRSPGPLHVSTDGSSSKRGISGVYDDQPGSASKRSKGESAVARLINTFDSPRSGTSFQLHGSCMVVAQATL